MGPTKSITKAKWFSSSFGDVSSFWQSQGHTHDPKIVFTNHSNVVDYSWMRRRQCYLMPPRYLDSAWPQGQSPYRNIRPSGGISSCRLKTWFAKKWKCPPPFCTILNLIALKVLFDEIKRLGGPQYSWKLSKVIPNFYPPLLLLKAFLSILAASYTPAKIQNRLLFIPKDKCRDSEFSGSQPTWKP